MNMFQRALLLILCALNLKVKQICKINSRIHFKEPLPLFLRDGKLLEPTDGMGNVELNEGDELVLSCESAGAIRNPSALYETETATISCRGGDNFGNEQWLNSPTSFYQLQCHSSPLYRSKRTERLCYDNHTVLEIGYKVNNVFYSIYETCFDTLQLRAIYSKYTQKPYNAFYQTKVDRPFFIADENFGNIPVNMVFSPYGQRNAVHNLIGNVVDNYITKAQFLARGHLAAKTDFVFAFGERATFHYLNCAPQWSGFNGGNWNTLEVDLRNHIHAAGYDTIIFTGTFGVTSLKNGYGTKIELYLSKDENNNRVIPVPEYFYKVVYDQSSKCGVAFIGINNPYYTIQEAHERFFCTDLCRDNSAMVWLTWVPDSSFQGYTFCCTVDDFKRTVPHLPHLQVDCFLT